MGCKIVAVSDVEGAVYCSGGVDVDKLFLQKRETGSVAGTPGTEHISNDELLELDCDFLIPAAIDRVIHEGNAHRVKARVVVEAANHPLTPEADLILNDRGIPVIPDILVNAGGVIVSYFEWSQNLYQQHWPEERVNDELARYMTKAYQAVRETARQENITFREAAFLIAVGRVAHVSKLRGFI